MLAVSSTFVVECTNGYFRCVSRHKYLQDGVALYELDNSALNFLFLLTILSGCMVDRNSYFGFANSNGFFSWKEIHEVAYLGRSPDRERLYLSIKNFLNRPWWVRFSVISQEFRVPCRNRTGARKNPTPGRKRLCDAIRSIGDKTFQGIFYIRNATVMETYLGLEYTNVIWKIKIVW